MSKWCLYILKCNDSSYYTGITNDLEKRVADHQNGKGAKYTRGRGPLILVYTENHPDRSSATKKEIFIKKLSRSQKKALINNQN
jgi:putative endonuclease